MKRKKKFLVTTALEETWPEDNQPSLLLGEWCLLYVKRDWWNNKDVVVLSYHWNNRERLFSDYQYILSLHERMLADLTMKLNEIHCVNYSIRYWRILIGPWLGYFISMLFDRWTSIKNAVTEFEVSETKIITIDPCEMIPNDMSHFVKFFVSDLWNHHIYTQILKQSTDINCIAVESSTSINQTQMNFANSTGRVKKINSVIYKVWQYLIKAFIRPKDALLISTYLPKWLNLKLQLRIGQMPNIPKEMPAPNIENVNMSKRNWVVPGENKFEFERFARWIIPQQIPKVYLEGYQRVLDEANNLPWPQTPAFIWTSNSQNGNDVFKIWAALKVENGTPLIIGQHGGHYGIGKWSFSEDHDTAISDKYLTWGWNDLSKKNLVSVGQLTSKQSTQTDHSKQERALLVLTSMPRYSYWMFSSCVAAEQYNDYIEDSFSFVANLSPAIKNALIVRLLKHDFGCCQVERWQDRYPDVHLDIGNSKMDELIKKSRLYISTYNATTFLESFTKNIPTVMFWNEEHWEIRESAVPYFEKLKEAKIFHSNAESAAKHVNQIWDDVKSWWESEDVQKVKRDFCDRYTYLPDNLLDRIHTVLKDTVKETR